MYETINVYATEGTFLGRYEHASGVYVTRDGTLCFLDRDGVRIKISGAIVIREEE